MINALDKIVISNKLKYLRGNVAREIVAKDLNISVSALQMYETGKRVPKDEIKIKIANYYHQSVQDIFFEYQNTNRVM